MWEIDAQIFVEKQVVTICKTVGVNKMINSNIK